jgi:hypothetical protein
MLRYTSAASRDHVSAQFHTFFASLALCREAWEQLAEINVVTQSHTFLHQAQHAEVHSAASRAHVSAKSVTFLRQAQHAEVHKRSRDHVSAQSYTLFALWALCREAREQLAKSATAADYKAYEREQQIRRLVDEEIAQGNRKMQVH